METTPLWHGTDEDSVSKIASGKFDRAFSGKNGKSLYKFLVPLYIFINETKRIQKAMASIKKDQKKCSALQTISSRGDAAKGSNSKS